MTYKSAQHIYLAAGFFNDSQRELCSYIEGLETSKLPIYSPRKDGFVLTPHASLEEKANVFASNKVAINNCQMVLAVIDDLDTGVVWEMGYAHAWDIPILAYSDVPGRGLNVMLAGCAGLGFVNGRSDLKAIFVEMSTIASDDLIPVFFTKFPRNTWPGEIQ